MIPPPPKAKRGRPRVAVPKAGSMVATWLTPEEHDKLIRAARAREQTVSGLVRMLIKSLKK
jgi:hypothetical protein